jgi:hypothetical protein
MKVSLTRLEAGLQLLIESAAARLFPGANRQPDLTVRIAAALRNDVVLLEDGRIAAPNLLTVWMSPGEAAAVNSSPARLDEAAVGIAALMRETASETGMVFTAPPLVRFLGDADLANGELRFVAVHSDGALPQTAALEAAASDAVTELPSEAYLIVDGTRIFPLQTGLVNIGRRPDNTLVIDDARISRQHAQLRAVNGHFVIFDLGSTGGTRVNGLPIRRQMLISGDVISLAGVPLIYGQESTRSGQTEAFSPDDPGHPERDSKGER